MVFIIFNIELSPIVHGISYLTLALSAILHFLIEWKHGFSNKISKLLFFCGVIGFIGIIVLEFLAYYAGISFGYFYWGTESLAWICLIWYTPYLLLDR